jgi:hypothetical protein
MHLIFFYDKTKSNHPSNGSKLFGRPHFILGYSS